ncbi:MAG: hypothetical protein FWE38_00510 [Firmicutes bacterium]|nr:hypothetical protein [Bacillota bacterium]
MEHNSQKIIFWGAFCYAVLLSALIFALGFVIGPFGNQTMSRALSLSQITAIVQLLLLGVLVASKEYRVPAMVLLIITHAIILFSFAVFSIANGGWHVETTLTQEIFIGLALFLPIVYFAWQIYNHDRTKALKILFWGTFSYLIILASLSLLWGIGQSINFDRHDYGCLLDIDAFCPSGPKPRIMEFMPPVVLITSIVKFIILALVIFFRSRARILFIAMILAIWINVAAFSIFVTADLLWWPRPLSRDLYFVAFIFLLPIISLSYQLIQNKRRPQQCAD